MPHETHAPNGIDGSHANGVHKKESSAIEYSHQAQKLAHLKPEQEDETTGSTQAAEAKFITPLDPVVETTDGKRLPAIPVAEAATLNKLKDEVDRQKPRITPHGAMRESKDGSAHGAWGSRPTSAEGNEEVDAPLAETTPQSRTNPLFPPLPLYGPPSWLRTLQCWFFRMSSAVLSLGFLIAIVIGAICDAIPRISKNIRRRAMLQNPKRMRPFYEEEMKRRQERRAADKAWIQQQQRGSHTPSGEKGDGGIPQDGEFIPTEGGPDPLCVDVGYYARRVGLESETFEVQTEDGFIIELWHIFNPREYKKPPPESYRYRSPDCFTTSSNDPEYGRTQEAFREGNKKYPVLMIHGLLQSSGAYICNDDDSFAFYLAKSGYDVWLGNNRCGFEPRHTSLSYEDPRMWAWNIRQMGVMDLAALVSRVLSETGFQKLALIAHSQGTTETFVALAKEQRPEIGEKISVFCALAPAAYAGPLIGKIYFQVMRLITPSMFRLVFGIHAFIPLMLLAHKILPPKPFSWMGYHVFSFLFNWSDSRWDRGLRDRMFQWAPVYVSAESMRWWLGRECFAKHKCILATHEEGKLEDKEDEEDDEIIRKLYIDREPHITSRVKLQRNLTSFHCQHLTHQHHDSVRGKFAWYDKQFPPLALWVCGADDLVDGRRLLRRFDRGREPDVRIVHKKIIEGYEHLDVIWAMDAIEKVGKEVREVIWRTVEPQDQRRCRTPVGCTNPLEADPPTLDVPMMHSGGRQRMASISEQPPKIWLGDGSAGDNAQQVVDSSREALEDNKEEWGQHPEEVDEAIFGRRLSEAHFVDLKEKGDPLDHVMPHLLGTVRE